MYSIETESSFDAAHFLRGHPGKCANLHGHRWRVTASFRGEKLQEAGPEAGMLTDFSRVKGALRELADGLDHRLLLQEGSLQPETVSALQAEGFSLVFFPFPTTAENLARWFYDGLRALPVESVAVYETPENCARYSEGGSGCG